MSQDVKLTFIARCVRDYVDEVVVAMERSIRRNNVVSTGALRDSLANAANENVGKLIFKEYGRFVDMGVGRGKPLSAIAAQPISSVQRKLRKRKKIYSPIAYGKLNGLMGDLMYGLTEETIATIKNELQTATTV